MTAQHPAEPSGSGSEATTAPDFDGAKRSAIIRQALSISLAVAPFGVAFGVATQQAGLSILEAMGFSLLVFGGSAQFAAVSVLADGGTPLAASLAGVLLSFRSLAFGVAMAPALRGRLWWRALVSQLMIDESTAVGTAQSELRWQRFGYLAGGIGVFVLWNIATLFGASAVAGADDFIEAAGIDATIGAAFLALIWPRLHNTTGKTVALGGAVIAFFGAPILPPGMAIVAAAAAVVLVWGRSPDDPAAGDSTSTTNYGSERR